jgi:hypothetical protein
VNIGKKNTKPWLIGGGGDGGPLRGNGIPIYLTLPNSSITPTFMYECFARPLKLMGKGMT